MEPLLYLHKNVFLLVNVVMDILKLLMDNVFLVMISVPLVEINLINVKNVLMGYLL